MNLKETVPMMESADYKERFKAEYNQLIIRRNGLSNMLRKYKAVYQYTKDFKLVRVWKSEAEANKNGYLDSEISLCCKNINKTHRGFRWSHKEL